jgi:hypothetical protein
MRVTWSRTRNLAQHVGTAWRFYFQRVVVYYMCLWYIKRILSSIPTCIITFASTSLIFRRRPQGVYLRKLWNVRCRATERVTVYADWALRHLCWFCFSPHNSLQWLGCTDIRQVLHEQWSGMRYWSIYMDCAEEPFAWIQFCAYRRTHAQITNSICLNPTGSSGNVNCWKIRMHEVVPVLLFLNWEPRHEGVLGEWRYSSTHSLTSALDGGEWLASRPGRFTGVPIG